MRRAPRPLLLMFPWLAGACGSTLPNDVPGYETRCLRLNAAPIAIYAGDPHKGTKHVYACNVDEKAVKDATAGAQRFPDGTMIVKESTRQGEASPWLIATARKQDGGWKWNEYTRESERDPFRHILAPESVCTGCHEDAKSTDWIFTTYERR